VPHYQRKKQMPITKPTNDVAANPADYLDEDSETAEPKIGTTVQQGWEAAEALLTENSTDFPTEFKFSEKPQLIKFLEDGPFRVYEQHWIERPTGKKSFVALAENDPFTDILGSKPRSRFAFNVVVLSGEAQGVQILTAPPTLARLIKKSHEDERKGPLSKEFWEISRMGTGPTTNYTMEFVRGRDLAEEWNLNLDEVQELVARAVPYTADVIRETPRSEMLKIARSLV
jgi:hypothetical protein